ncbi:arylsulfatase [Draconibacterium sp. IB214405]|uniref:arylsulfatase n=1 Tax=Draconibacterium sp. IB214405 TaxID=3097352 RepID=UPI002A0EE0B2|nr:arylsulfatase [Draconibacterium sp. IB214405]MDX8338856.1 arylsulfatase [Draconibacterium sp. IB214405]
MKTNYRLLFSTFLLAVILISCQQTTNESSSTSTASADGYDRTILPMTSPEYPAITELDARNVTAPPAWSVKAPEGAPNVVIVLIDDMGFGQSSSFGGAIRMPTADKLAERGIQFNRFHTTALCSPTRTALLSGRNHHSNNMGGITEVATAFPGNTGMTPQSCAYVSEVLKLNGYNTAQFGKNHETAAWEVSPSGPFTRWPVYKGFEKFYGFMGGETNQFYPGIYDGTTRVEVDTEDPDYHFSEDMTEKAIAWMKAQKSLTPDKPFFMYYAPGATHAPHQVPESYLDKYKGEFDDGWDAYRQKTLERQIKLGLVPEGTKLAEKPEYIKDWDSLSAPEKKVFARQMEIFAAFGEHIDEQVGHLYDAIEDLGIAENTMFIYILGDNGASAEGMANGLLNENTYFNGVAESVEDMAKNLDKLGTRESYGHFAAGWAVAGNTPFKWTKQVAGNFGGTRNGLIIVWPGKLKETNVVRDQFCHAIDIVPTILEAANVPQPVSVNGVEQRPIEGFSMLKTFTDPETPEFHNTQYFEIVGNRAIYNDGWVATTVHKAPWEAGPRGALTDDKWELYDVTKDFSESTDLAAENPEKVAELKQLFMDEAVKYNVLPIDDRTIERFDPATAGRPDLMGGRKSLTVYEGMSGMLENAFINIKNTSSTFTTEVEVKSGAEGVIIAMGGAFGGYSLFLDKGKPVFTYNWVGLEEYDVESSKALSAGKHTIKFDFAYDGGGMGKGGNGTLYVDGEKVGEGRFPNTNGNMFSLDEGADVGFDEATNVSSRYKVGDNHFSGKINYVTIDIE